ncbi:putative U3 small nucleolar RNA-associated protein 15 [Paratrimastix pyriformis]|uniref:U3 small nucleolar RNA-associated protein 15 n=1 Tax=Paratrimastix pyriformis TaxID=342808 RepID=A0ABQ8UVH2_9EUKA|nr:putative U3 small nucleolar RNA-associated protein 15 [Paratrimastix pyriformis]
MTGFVVSGAPLLAFPGSAIVTGANKVNMSAVEADRTAFKKLSIKRFPKEGLRRTPEAQYWRKFKFPVLINENATPTCIDFSPVAPHDFAVTGGVRIQIYDSHSLKPKRVLSRFKGPAYSGRFRSDGRILVAGGEEGIVQVFDIQTRAVLRQITSHRGPVHTTSFSRDNTTIISGGDDCTLRLHDLPTGAQVGQLTGHSDYVRAAAESPSTTSLIATASYDHTVCLWDRSMPAGGVADGAAAGPASRPMMTLQHGAPVEALVFLPGGALIATAGGNTVKIWDVLGTSTLLHEFSTHQKTITSMCVEGSQSRLITGGLDGFLKVHSLADYRVTHAMKYPGPVASLALSPANEHLVVGMSLPMLSIRRRDRAEEDDLGALTRTLGPGEDIRRDPALSMRPLPAEEGEDGTGRYFARKKNVVTDQDDFLVEAHRRKRLQPYEALLKRFQYRAALDAALATRNPLVVVSLVAELLQRGGLIIALSARNDEQLEPLVQFMLRHICNPRYAPLPHRHGRPAPRPVLGVLGQSVVIDELFVSLRQQVATELGLQEQLHGMVGMLDALLEGASRNAPATASTPLPLPVPTAGPAGEAAPQGQGADEEADPEEEER